MMVEIRQDFIPVGRYNRPGIAMDYQFITIHETDNYAAGAGAAAHASYIKNVTTATSWHYTVDDKIAYQHLPLNETAYHCGDGSGNGNRKSVGIEICVNSDCDYEVSKRNVAELAAKLLKDKNLGIDAVKQHYDWNGKNCPRRLRQEGRWNEFLGLIKSFMGEQTTPPSGSGNSEYVVQKGDCLSVIGTKFNVKWQDIAVLNNVKGPKYIIYVGQKLAIPQGGSNNTSNTNAIVVGSKVKILASASRYATGETIPSRYKEKVYTVMQVKSDRVLIKELYSWVYTKDVG